MELAILPTTKSNETMKKNWHEMSFEEKSLMVAQIEESYQNKTLFKNAADAAHNVRIGYEEDPDWFNFEVTDLDEFEEGYAELIAEDFA